jgi:TPR repeat protein
MEQCRKAAEQGDAEMQWRLGGFYEFGFGVEQDKAEAEKWFQKAAEQGNFAAQQRLRKIERGRKQVEAPLPPTAKSSETP